MPLSVFAMMDSVMTRSSQCVVASGGRVFAASGRCACFSSLINVILRDEKSKAKIKRRKAPRFGAPCHRVRPVVSLRLPRELTAAVEAWAKRQPDKLSRSKAFRQLVEMALADERPASSRSSKARSKASELAGKEIDRMADQTATAEDRESRKRRLLTGPKEFREMRRDHPTKAKA